MKSKSAIRGLDVPKIILYTIFARWTDVQDWRKKKKVEEERDQS